MNSKERAQEIAKIYSDFRKSEKCWNICVNNDQLLVTICHRCNATISEWSLDNSENQPVCEDCS
jgi:hypothetical protein